MADFDKMSVQSLRDLARKMLGPGHSRLKKKADLVAALERAAGGGEKPAKGATRAAAPAEKQGSGAGVAGKAVRAVRAAGKAAREGVRAAARAGKAAAEEAKAVADEARAGARRGAKGAKGAGKARAAVEGAVAGAAAAIEGAVAGAAAALRARRRPHEEEGAQDPEGYFVARVRGEDAARGAPHPMVEADAPAEAPARDVAAPVTMFDEGLGDLPWSYGDDAFVALPRDPRTLFLYWDWSGGATRAAFEAMDHARVQLWVFARAGEGWDRIRTLECALESRSYYVHDLEPGRSYRGELHAIDRAGRERMVGHPSNEIALPPVGPSPVVDDRFIRLPWDVPLGALLGPGHAAGPFPDDARALFSRLSDWSRFQGRVWGGSAGGMGGRPFSPTSGPSSPAPSSPSGPYGRGEA